MELGDLRLEREDTPCGTRGLRTARDAAEIQQPREVRTVLVADLAELRIIAQVELPLGQTEARVREDDDMPVGVLLVDGDPTDDRRGDRDIGPVHDPRDIRMGGELAYLVEHGLHGREAARLDRRGVHEGAVVVTDLALRCPLGSRVRRQILDDLARIEARAIGELVEGAPARAVGRQHFPLHPTAARVAEKIVARANNRVFASGVETPSADLGGFCGCRYRQQK